MAKVLIADDSPSIRILLKDILVMGDHEVVGEAIDGEDAIQKFAELNPDVLLLDLAMPKKDGLQVLKELNPKNPKMKVIVITANGSNQVFQDCMKNGASGYIDKPFDIKEVLDQIAEVTNLLTVK
ncbi:MAG: response regulator [Nitrosopumilaceae archaeon]|nr:response regulator [Nitrosopumilaceae archaeon]